MKQFLFLFAFVCLLIGNKTFSQQDTASNKPKSDSIFSVIDVMPSYVGGEDKMYQFLAENIRYPQVAKEKGITGKVTLSFIVETDGSITNASIIKDIGGGCGEEALRIVNLMPKWKPGKLNGVPVRVLFKLPIHFSLE